MSALEEKAMRLAELHGIDDRPTRVNLSSIRPEATPGEPVIDVEEVLAQEVTRCQARLDAALHDLARWRLSHGTGDTKP